MNLAIEAAGIIRIIVICKFRSKKYRIAELLFLQKEVGVEYDPAPSKILRIKNLNHKKQKEEQIELLRELFSFNSSILRIDIDDTYETKRQASICFKDIGSASEAMNRLMNLQFREKCIDIQYANDASDSPEEKGIQKPEIDSDVIQKEESTETVKSPASLAAPKTSNILIVEGLTMNVTKMMLINNFKDCEGLNKVHMIKTKHMALVEYETIRQARKAVATLQGRQITEDYALSISYAKE